MACASKLLVVTVCVSGDRDRGSIIAHSTGWRGAPRGTGALRERIAIASVIEALGEDSCGRRPAAKGESLERIRYPARARRSPLREASRAGPPLIPTTVVDFNNRAMKASSRTFQLYLILPGKYKATCQHR